MNESAEILKSALYNEVKSHIFYSKAAKTTTNGESRMLFLELSGMEENHVRLIIKKVGGVSLSGEFDPEAYINNLETSMENTLSVKKSKILQTGEMKEILELAIDMEKRALEAYLDLAKKLVNPKIKSLCQDLAKEEKKHLDSVTSTLLSLDMDDDERPPL